MEAAPTRSRTLLRRRKLFDFRYIPHERRQSYVAACILFGSVLLYAVVTRYVVASVEVVGPSMLPGLRDGDRLLLHRWLYHLREPRRGDIVVIRDPTDDTLAVKRVVGLAGEAIDFQGGRLRINGVPLAEDYLSASTVTLPLPGCAFIPIPQDHYFVLGDNRERSADSRHFGPIPRWRIEGWLSPPEH